MLKALSRCLARWLGAHSPAYQALFTLARGGARVGADPLGNAYYEAPARGDYRAWTPGGDAA